MSRRNKEKEEAAKPLAMRASDLADWIESIEKSPGMIRAFKRWWHRSAVFGLALDALDELAELEKKNGCHDKIRRSLNTMVMAMGGAELKWQGGSKSD